METPDADGGQPILLVLRALKLGDLLVAVPALHALRRAYPEHRLLYAAQDWLAEALVLVDGFELLPTHGLDVPIPIGAGRVDVAVNLHGSGPESDRRLAEIRPGTILGHRTAHRPGPSWVEDIHERERWTRLLRWHGIEADAADYRLRRPAVASPCPAATVLHVGAAYGSRLWPAERFAAVARQLAADGHTMLGLFPPSSRDR